MVSLEDKIPAFPMWKMFYDTISALLKLECSESSIKHLANIVNSQELTRILVFNHDPTLDHEQYDEISQKYKAFTIWLLGQFFHLLSSEKLSRIHKLVIDAQLRILHQISITQPHIYHELTNEYTKILKQLNRCDSNNAIKLTVFTPQQFDDLKQRLDLSSVTIEINSSDNSNKLKSKILLFVKHILIDNLCSHNINEEVYDTFTNLIFILKEDNFDLKFAVLDIYKSILEKHIINIDIYPEKLKEHFHYFSGILEQLTYDIYNLKITVNTDTMLKLEDILLCLFCNECKINYQVKINISSYLFNKLKYFETEHNNKISEKLLLECNKFFLTEKLDERTDYQLNVFDNLLTKNTILKLKFIEKKTISDIKAFVLENCIPKLNIMVETVSKTWQELILLVKQLLMKCTCQDDCELENTLTFFKLVFGSIKKIKLSLQYFIISETNVQSINQEFFKEAEFILLLLSYINTHVETCKVKFPYDNVFKIFMTIPIGTTTDNINIIFHVVAYSFLPIFYKSNSELPINLVGRCDKNEAAKNIKILYNHLATLYDKPREFSFPYICEFIHLLSSGLVDRVDDITKFNLDGKFTKIVMDVYHNFNSFTQSHITLANNFVHITSYIKNIEPLSEILSLLLASPKVRLDTLKMLPELICILHSSYTKVIIWSETKRNNFSVQYQCIDCKYSDCDEKSILKTVLKTQFNSEIYGVYCVCEAVASNEIKQEFLKIIYDELFISSSAEQQISSIYTLPSLAKHNSLFHSPNTTKKWMVAFAGSEYKIARQTLNKIILPVLKLSQENPTFSNDCKDEIIDVCLITLQDLTKKSLQNSDYELQDTLLETIDQITSLKVKTITLRTMKMLLYFIMIPTSKYSAVAINVFNQMASKQGTKVNLLYGKYRKEMCQCIAELCAINQALVKYDLNTSLKKISLVLGFFETKDFIHNQSFHLLPFFVALIAKMPPILELIREVAKINEVDLGDLLASNYGKIFLHIFLNETDEVFKNCMNYLEETTGLKGPILRKRNFKIILNELLLNFHEKQDRVLLALRLLAKEDTEAHGTNTKYIKDYLQPQFLGVLNHFDTKLFAKEQVLLSLAQIFKFMGPKRIAPFRFKIIAMLRTALVNYGNYPELNCNVWDAFVRSCDTEALGPQLATIFVSVLPLSQHYPEKIDNIFRYLVVENEALLKDYIPDLFFVLDFEIGHEIHAIIKKHMETFESCDFKQQLKLFLKYLTHETNDIKIHALKYLKNIMEKNREELDQMILGYNGIDPTIVELLDILTLGCREKDQMLKLACGECIGELGAIEPSHLPRKYTQAQSFTFFITEDNFVLHSLNELIRALQAEKNTKRMDRFALAIQETLKHYGISPDVNSTKHNLWKSFPQSQQELMLPLLSSRYVMGQSLQPTTISPIYESKVGATFQSWVYNWTCILIITIKPDKRNLLEVCLPSLKDDNRLLLHFLPHILLHSLLEGTHNDQEKAHAEMMAVISSFTSKKAIDDDLLYIRPLCTSHFISKPQLVTSDDIKQNQCTKIVFVLLDFLDRWIREWEWQRGAVGRDNEDYKTIQNFLARFCKLQLARCNFECGEYPRALMHLEDYITKNPDEFVKHLSFLAELYAQLDEPDAVAGVTALQHTEPTVEQRILALEVSGKLTDAAACYERITPPLKLHHLQGLIQCYLDLDNVNTAFNLAEGAIEKQPEYKVMLLEMQAEPLWRLGKYDDLNNLLQKPELNKNESWGVEIGHLLLHLQNGKRDEFQTVLSALRNQQVNALSATSLEEGAYQHGYGFIAKLHIINELEQIGKMIHELLVKPNDHNACESVIKTLTSEWELRIKVVQESIKIIEPILCLRRVALEQAKKIVSEKVPSSVPLINSLLGQSWLRSAKIARRTKVHQQAYTYTLKAEEYSPPCLFLEKAKLHWMREEHEHALTTLKRGIEKLIPEGADSDRNFSQYLSLEQKKICAEARLLYATYNDNISNVDAEVNVKYYKEAIDVFREREKSLVSLAQYYDRMFQTFSDEDRDVKGTDMQIHMINYFGKSLQYGTSYVYQSMPRLLSIWFDYGTRLLDAPNNIKEERKNNLLKMTKLIDTYLERLPAYIFLTAFSQIISRICHPQKEVYIELKSIIIKIMLQYPQQTMWMMISVIKSSYTVRSRRCAEILNDSRLKNSSMTKLVGDFTKLAEKLIELCNKEINESVNVTNVNNLLRSLPRLLSKDDLSEIMMPTQKFRKLVLPNPDFKSSQHNPFPNHYVHIVGIDDEIVILASLQRPRKITLRGSDGKGYIQMLKPKDDLRKDFRLMEFNDIVNQLLSREAESRQRRLNIRLYSVAPLNEECGLIEWVPNLVGLRPILMNLYKQRGQIMKGSELKNVCCNIRDSIKKKRSVFLDVLLPRHPPVLSDWFRKTFPDAQGWLMARTAYTRTTAVISMVGYILGLGDRHGENINLDSTSGDTVHVDFNCLFNKGETFEWPERVPFRLTHNMVSAMGPLGVEGVFRKSCACTLGVLRTHTNTLMSIVTPFVYDPLVSWPRNSSAAANALSSERTNEQAVEHVRNIKIRLQGMIRTKGRSISIPLSVEGQANNIILEAMNIDNLCQMYVGWGAYL